MATYTPPGWPAGVHPPGSDDFESTAVGWLLDVVPPDYRLHGVLRRYPVALATMARYHSRACVEAARQGYRTARTELAGTLPPHAIDTVLAVYRKEGARLAATARAVGLVERALRGEVFTPKMSPDTTADTQAAAHSPAGQPSTGGPSTAEPTIAQPKAAEPKAAGLKTADLKTADLKTAPPKTAPPKTADLKTAEPKAAQPETAQLKTAGPTSRRPARRL
ncbi:MAG: hypothetical protein ACRDOH_35860 [Streptosporangiaceae bacterium]